MTDTQEYKLKTLIGEVEWATGEGYFRMHIPEETQFKLKLWFEELVTDEFKDTHEAILRLHRTYGY